VGLLQESSKVGERFPHRFLLLRCLHRRIVTADMPYEKNPVLFSALFPAEDLM